MFDVSFPLFIRVPFLLSGGVSTLSCRLDLMYFQKGFLLLFSRSSCIILLTYSISADLKAFYNVSETVCSKTTDEFSLPAYKVLLSF